MKTLAFTVCIGLLATPPAASPSEMQRSAAPATATITQLEKTWGAYAHIADKGGWWREAKGAFWHYAWDGIGKRLVLRQYDSTGKLFHSTALRIDGDSLVNDQGVRGAIKRRDRLHFGDLTLSPDLNRLSSAYEYGGHAYRYDWVRSSQAEFEAAVRSSHSLPPPPPLLPSRVVSPKPKADPATRSELGRRIDAAVRAVPTSFHVFMSGREAEKIVQMTTVGCRTVLKTSGGVTGTIDWSQKGAEPDHGTFAQMVGTRTSDGTLASFSAHIPGQTTVEQTMGTRYAREFDSLSADMTLLWKSCSGAKE